MVKNRVIFFMYFFFGVLVLANCQVGQLAGHYVEHESYGIKHELSLFNDSSFEYAVKEGFACDTLLGIWNVVNKKQIILSPKKIKNYHFESKCDTCADKFYIKTFALPDNYELSKPDVKVYNKGMVIKDGMIDFVGNTIMQKADSIQINYFGFESYTFMPQNEKNAVANIFLIEEQQGLLQRDRILRIKGRKLITEKDIILKKQP